jgi:hypothetical protein
MSVRVLAREGAPRFTTARVAEEAGAPLYRDAPEVRRHRDIGMRRLLTFMDEALPKVPAKERAFAAAFVMTTMTAVGKNVSIEACSKSVARSKSEVDAWAVAMGDMLCISGVYCFSNCNEQGRPSTRDPVPVVPLKRASML